MLEIVIPLFNEEANVGELHRRVRKVCDSLSMACRISYVNDGSTDATGELLEELAGADGRVQIIELSRNFGHQAAIRAGLEQATGEAVVLLDGDLQDPPEVIPELVTAWQAGANVVIAQRRSRRETGFRRLCFDVFHGTFKYLADCEVPPHTGTFCLMDQVAVDAVNQLTEAHRFFPGLRALVGFDQALVAYDRHDRLHGEPKQNFRRLLRYAADGVFSFSFKPLRLMTAAGAAICLISLLVACVFFAKRLAGWESAPMGFTTLACGVFAMGGIQIIGLGILGEYLGRVFEEVKRRPSHFVREVKSASIARTIQTTPAARGRRAA